MKRSIQVWKSGIFFFFIEWHHDFSHIGAQGEAFKEKFLREKKKMDALFLIINCLFINLSAFNYTFIFKVHSLVFVII